MFHFSLLPDVRRHYSSSGPGSERRLRHHRFHWYTHTHAHTQTDTDIQSHTHTDTHTHRHTHRQTHTQSHTQTHTNTQRHTPTMTHRHTHPHNHMCVLLITSGAGDFYCSGNDLSNFTSVPEGGLEESARRGGELLR